MITKLELEKHTNIYKYLVLKTLLPMDSRALAQ